MISATEMEWSRMMVETQIKEGYSFYVLREVYSDDNCDLELYVSAEPISFSSANVFTVVDGLLFKMDSSPRYGTSASYTGTSVVSTAFSGRCTARSYEFIYSNAGFDNITLVPDIRQIGGVQHEESQTALGANLFVLLAFCLSCFAIKLFRS